MKTNASWMMTSEYRAAWKLPCIICVLVSISLFSAQTLQATTKELGRATTRETRHAQMQWELSTIQRIVDAREPRGLMSIVTFRSKKVVITPLDGSKPKTIPATKLEVVVVNPVPGKGSTAITLLRLHGRFRVIKTITGPMPKFGDIDRDIQIKAPGPNIWQRGGKAYYRLHPLVPPKTKKGLEPHLFVALGPQKTKDYLRTTTFVGPIPKREVKSLEAALSFLQQHPMNKIPKASAKHLLKNENSWMRAIGVLRLKDLLSAREKGPEKGRH